MYIRKMELVQEKCNSSQCVQTHHIKISSKEEKIKQYSNTFITVHDTKISVKLNTYFYLIIL